MMEALANLIEEQVKRREYNRKFLDDNARAMRGLEAIESSDFPKIHVIDKSNGKDADAKPERGPLTGDFTSRVDEPKQEKSLVEKIAPYALVAGSAIAGAAGLDYMLSPDKPPQNQSSEQSGDFIENIESIHPSRSLLQAIEDEGMHVTE